LGNGGDDTTVGGRGKELQQQILNVPNAQLVAIADIYSRHRDEAKQMAPSISDAR
jgi:hypothetical protein